MTSITVNDQEIKDPLDPSISIEDLKKVIMRDFAMEGDVITCIQLDNEIYNFPEYISGNKEIGEYQTINFIVKSSLNLAFDAIDSCHVFIDLVIQKINLLMEDYNKNDLNQLNAHFIEVVENMDLFVQLIDNINKTLYLYFGEKYNKDKIIRNLESALLSIVKSLIPVKEKNDIIMLCDLLQYELVDNLEEWKMKAIPELKRFKKIKTKQT